MPEFSYGLKIPKERIAVLIGKDGEVKKELEEQTKTTINIDSNDGDVAVSGDDALYLYSTRDVIRAIGRGFNPDVAMLLLRQDYSFELIHLPDFENPNQFRRIKGRVIGKEGKTREIIEQTTDTFISVYGKTIGIIGQTEKVNTARRAVEMLIRGSPHSNVYRWLERQRRDMRRRELEEEFDMYVKDE